MKYCLRNFAFLMLLFSLSTGAVFADTKDENYKKAKRLRELSVKTDNPELRKKYEDQILKLAPESEFGWFVVSKRRAAQKDPKGEIEALRKSIRVNPRFISARFNLAYCLYDAFKNREAREHWKKLIKMYPGSSTASKSHFMIGYTYVNIRNSFENASSGVREDLLAEKHLKEALKINPEYADAHQNLIKLYRSNLSYGKAIVHLKILMRIKPKFVGYVAHIAFLYEHSKEKKKALFYYKKACRMGDNDSCAGYERLKKSGK